jgi:hypothetical protein
MISRNRILALAGALAAMLPLVIRAGAQMGPRMGRGPGYYDPASETVIHGVVETVRDNASFCRWGGTEVALKTDKKTLTVSLGPTPFLSQSDFSVAKGDKLSVTGFEAGGQTPYLIAREVTKGDRTLTLRDAQGFPVWAGRGIGWRAHGGGRCGRGGPGCGCRCRWW